MSRVSVHDCRPVRRIALLGSISGDAGHLVHLGHEGPNHADRWEIKSVALRHFLNGRTLSRSWVEFKDL